MAGNTDAQDRQDYQDYVDYQAYANKTQNSGLMGSLKTALSGAALGYGPEVAAGQAMAAAAPNPFVKGGMDQAPRDFNQDVQSGRQDLAEYAKAHPIGSVASGLAGSVLAAPVIGAGLGAMGLGSKAVEAGAPLLSRAATYGGNIVRGAGAGGLLGAVSNPNQSGDGTDFNVDARLQNSIPGAAMGAVIPAASGLLQEGGRLAGAAGKGLLKFSGLAPDRAIDEYIDRYPEIQASSLEAKGNPGVLPIDQLGDKVAGAASGLRDSVVSGSDLSKEILGNANIQVPLQPLVDTIDQEIAGLKIAGKGALGEGAQQAISKLQNLKTGVSQLGDSVDGPGAKQIIQQLQSDTDYGRRTDWSDSANNAYKSISRTFNEQLKDASPQYRSAMEQIAPKADLLDRLRSLGVNPDNELESSDAAARLVKSLGPGKTGQQAKVQLLKELGDASGHDFLGNLKNQKLLDEFEKASGKASRNAIIGGALGGAAGLAMHGPEGALLGAGAGAAAGKRLDVEGGRAVKGLIDAAMRAKEKAPAIGAGAGTAAEAVRNYLIQKHKGLTQ